MWSGKGFAEQVGNAVVREEHFGSTKLSKKNELEKLREWRLGGKMWPN